MAKVTFIFKAEVMGVCTPNKLTFVEAQDENGKRIDDLELGEWVTDGEHETLTMDCSI